jgi:hypothetical protein
MTFHDLRATGITWMAIRGDEPIKIMRRAGHENITTTMGYVREAENLEYPVGEVFPAVPSALLVSSAESSEGPAYWAQLRGNIHKNAASPAGHVRDLADSGAPPDGTAKRSAGVLLCNVSELNPAFRVRRRRGMGRVQGPTIP